MVFFLLLTRARARPLFLNSFSNSIIGYGKKRNPTTDHSLSVEIRLQISRSIANATSGFRIQISHSIVPLILHFKSNKEREMKGILLFFVSEINNS